MSVVFRVRLRVKRPGREADHSPPSSTEVKNAWSYTSSPQYVFMAWCLVKHMDRFTFVTLLYPTKSLIVMTLFLSKMAALKFFVWHVQLWVIWCGGGIWWMCLTMMHKRILMIITSLPLFLPGECLRPWDGPAVCRTAGLWGYLAWDASHMK
jgi:hypothetical protein